MSAIQGKAMRYLLLILFLVPTYSSANETLIEEMINAKVAGACGIMRHMLRFQEQTKIKGGDEFILRFVSRESTSLLLTGPNLVDSCGTVIEKYNSLVKSWGED